VSLTFDLGADEIHLVTVCRGSSQESNPVAVTHAASVHLRDFVVTAEPVSNLKNTEQHNDSPAQLLLLCLFQTRLFDC
jgi:hypothetical protein